MKKIGLVGGTFDPPHYGHLLIAEEVYDGLSLDEIWFIPSNEPPHKAKSNTDATYRVAMLEAATSDNPHFKVNTIEMERQGKSYTIDTIKLLNERYPDTTFYFIIGADMVEYLPKWYQIEELVKLIQFVGVKRNDYELITEYPIMEVNIPSVEISSTMIRQRIKNHQSIRYLVPPKVLDVIKEYRLYDES
ncbi:nicotinate-nucleotide adenylyltransferase [Aquibacillus koreensis]|uniref:Probable nicotinate-nucleotide adenylyltransferase n=1 Tax=Aquibacillus koreensis TaxID=279446 RepID=A0A9X4AGH9_9BACI|nr:nicotinate-nucleotide adenylyltransferase [Aquibacillus koreensis]MCT2537631.1 nicotinate-nucleotide adenylyltransferase [Aquibacillus koreensis]MDC3419077.1 nicotinate-nucleotide adenylyltransferase [Aquibacillus koreensis]